MASAGSSATSQTARMRVRLRCSSAARRVPCGVTTRFDDKGVCHNRYYPVTSLRMKCHTRYRAEMQGNPIFMQQAIALATENVISGRGGRLAR